VVTILAASCAPAASAEAACPAVDTREYVVPGRVVDTAGKPVAAADLLFRSWFVATESYEFESLRSDAEGRFRLVVRRPISTRGACGALVHAVQKRAGNSALWRFFAGWKKYKIYIYWATGRKLGELSSEPEEVYAWQMPLLFLDDDPDGEQPLGDLRVLAPQHRLRHVRLRTSGASPPKSVRVVLDPPGDFRVKLLAPGGKPVAGARVAVARVDVTDKVLTSL